MTKQAYAKMIDLEIERDGLNDLLNEELKLNNSGYATEFENELFDKIVKLNREIHQLEMA